MRVWWILVLSACTASSSSAPTWHGEVAPVVAQRCASCHTAGGIGPFALDTYEEAAQWAPALLASVENGSMPPFDAESTDECTPRLPFKHDVRMSDEETTLLREWVEADAPEGDADAAAPLDVVAPPALDEVDAEYFIPEPFEVAGTTDIYRCFRIPLELADEVWVRGVEVLPDNDKVVHHVLVWSDPEDNSAELDDGSGYPCSGTPEFFPTELMSIWTPGGGPMLTPEGTGIPLKPGGSIVVNVHYHPSADGAEVDQTGIALDWMHDKPDNYVTWFLADLPFGAEPEDGRFEIPAGAREHVENLIFDPEAILGFELPLTFPIFAITPHMHYLGQDMRVKVRRPSGDEECLVHTPDYRFDWQTAYVYDAPISQLPTFGPGDSLQIRCTYNNSRSNPHMRDYLEASGLSAPTDVRWGQHTEDEMCMAMVGWVTPPTDLFALVGALF